MAIQIAVSGIIAVFPHLYVFLGAVKTFLKAPVLSSRGLLKVAGPSVRQTFKEGKMNFIFGKLFYDVVFHNRTKALQNAYCAIVTAQH